MSNATVEQVKSQVQQLNAEADDIEQQIFAICNHMNGGVTWNEAWGMSPLQRLRLFEYLEKIQEKQQQKLKQQRLS